MAMTEDEPLPGTSQEKISNPTSPGQPAGSSKDMAFPACGDFDMRIASDGTWFYRGSPIGRKALVKLFSTVIRRDDHGDFWLVTPVERGRIQVDDAPFTAVELAVSGSGEAQVLRFRNNVDDWVEAGPEHPIRVETNPETLEPRPYITVRDRLEALILRPLFYELVELSVEREAGQAKAGPENVSQGSELGIWSNGVFFPLGSPA